ncbi:MAG: hypothetical protein K6B44_10760 [Lachnospiraceae bacterium]|nr:hypothetical protein [Lachnospiraceae bacterium]
MRITNKVMQNNSLKNINNNKVLQDELNTQLATGKKIARPSEDPVVAIRALRLRTDVSQVNQYYEKNIPDAKSWLALTESSIQTTISVVKDIVEQCEKGSSDQLTTSDRQTIIDSLKALRDEIYKTGDSDYAGRYVFTGYRTDTSLSFGKVTSKQYSITECFDLDDLQEMPYLKTADLMKITETNYDTTTAEENDIEEIKYYRFRLSYGNLDDTVPTLTYRKDGTDYAVQPTIQTDKEAAYTAAASNPDAIYLIPDTGELVMGKNIYEDINSSKEKMHITYSKTNWASTDLRPEHYFYCESSDDKGNIIKYNPDYLINDTVSPEQEISYQMGFDQAVQVNTYASDIYKHDIGRDVDEITALAEKLNSAEELAKKLGEMKKDPNKYPDASGNLAAEYDAAQKAVTFLKDELQKRFSNYITRSQGYMNNANEELTKVGNRSKRVSLAENRLAEQQVTFKTLQSENEDIDATEAAVQLSSASVSYEAALMATGKMIQTTLLNYL